MITWIREQKDYIQTEPIATVNLLGLIQSKFMRKNPDDKSNSLNSFENIQKWKEVIYSQRKSYTNKPKSDEFSKMEDYTELSALSGGYEDTLVKGQMDRYSL